MTYAEKLRNPKWQKRRLEIFKRDNFSCQFCGDSETELHVHHEYYKSGIEPWEYSNDSLKTVCKYCHQIIEYVKSATIDKKNFIKIRISDFKDDPISTTHLLLYNTTADVYQLWFLSFNKSKSDISIVVVLNEPYLDNVKELIATHRKLANNG